LAFAGIGTPLHIAAVFGRTEAIAALLAAGASVASVDLQGNTCLSLAAGDGHTTAVRQLLAAWQTPPADVLHAAIAAAAEHDHWDAAVLLVRKRGKQDMAAAAELMRAMPDAVPELLDAVLGSEAEQQAAALQDEARQLAEQRRGLQALVLGFAGKLRKQEAVGLHGVKLHDRCCDAACAAAAAECVASVQTFVQVSAPALEADGAGFVKFADNNLGPRCQVPRVNKRKRRR
jgi:hypothetical protein